VAALATERLLELAFSVRNCKIALAAEAIGAGHDHYVFVSTFHFLFLLCLVLEAVWLRHPYPGVVGWVAEGVRSLRKASLLGGRDTRGAVEYPDHHLPLCCAGDGRPLSLPAPSQLPGRDNRNGPRADAQRMLADRDCVFAGQCGAANGAHPRGREVAR
jgi:hypothetical protein